MGLSPSWPLTASAAPTTDETAQSAQPWPRQWSGHHGSPDPAIRRLAAELAHLGQPHMFRPYNDTRFHMRPPIKEQLGLAIGYGGAATGWSWHSTGCSWPRAFTRRHPTSSAATEPPSTTAAARRRSRRRSPPALSPRPPELKRAPRGYPMVHPRIERLRMKETTVYNRHGLEPWLHTPAAVGRIRGELEGARPLVTWLAKHVGPSERPRD